jgi:protein-tyrosine phosphatase
MIDVHCHILPFVDDGAKSWEMAVAMCRVAIADGVKHIVATPHCNDRYVYERERFQLMLGELSERIGSQLTFSLGCDFHFSYENVQDALANKGRYVIGNSGYLLVEFSDYGIAPTVQNLLERLMNHGMTPIITHPERNMLLLKQPERVLEFADQGCWIQVTANSFTGFWGDRSREMAKWLLAREAVHVVASDAHDPERRSPVLSLAREVIDKLAGSEMAIALFEKNPATIVQCNTLPHQGTSYGAS